MNHTPLQNRWASHIYEFMVASTKVALVRFLKQSLGVCIAGLMALTIFGPAHAQTPSPLAEWQYSSGIQLQQLFMPTIPTWQVELGVGAAAMPAAMGMKHYRILPGPAIDIRYKNIAFLSSGEGIGANLFSFRHISVGGAFTYNMGRSPSQDRKVLEGMGTIHPVPEFKIFATTVLSKTFPLTIRMDVRKQLKGSNGYIGDIGAYMPMPGSSEKFFWFVGPTLTVANTRYMTTYYGVNHNQTHSTHYRYYKAYGGIESAGLGVSANYFMTSHFILSASATYARLLGSAANSPITQTDNQAIVALAVLYKF